VTFAGPWSAASRFPYRRYHRSRRRRACRGRSRARPSVPGVRARARRAEVRHAGRYDYVSDSPRSRRSAVPPDRATQGNENTGKTVFLPLGSPRDQAREPPDDSRLPSRGSGSKGPSRVGTRQHGPRTRSWASYAIVVVLAQRVDAAGREGERTRVVSR